MSKSIVSLLTFVFLLTACIEDVKIVHPIKTALTSKNIKIRRVVDSINQFEVQIKYTQIKRQGDSIYLKDYEFQVNDSTYFYPASTVKFPIAVLTLEKLNTIDSIDLNTRYYVEGDSTETTFASDISKIFAISDNQANNRLFEFLGQDAINETLEQKGISPIRISHRLSTENAAEISTKPLVIYQNDSTTTLLKSLINTTPVALKIDKLKKGKGFYAEDSLYLEPFNFELKNYYPISTQHALLKRIIFPNHFPLKEQLHLNKVQREFLLKSMHTLPKELGYDSIAYYDSYVKFLMFGDDKDTIPNHIKIYNKVGYAYGTLTDCAYIVDSKNDVEFMLTATILVNKNGIFNDNEYEYDDIGIPFLAQLGRELYNQELLNNNN